MSPTLLQLSLWRTSNYVKQPSHLCTFIQAPVLFSRRISRWSVPLRSLTKPLSLASLTSSRFSCPSRIYSLRARRWLALENAPSPITSWINYVIARCKLSYFLFGDVTGFRIPSPDFLTGILLRVPMLVERDFDFPKKRQGKKVSWIILSTPANASPVFILTCFINIHFSWTACTTAA